MNVYLDESGTHDLNGTFIYAGVAVPDGPLQLKIERHLAQLAEKYIRREDLSAGVVFHATNLMQGNGAFKTYDRDRLRDALQRLCEVPRLFNLPVLMGVCDVDRIARKYEISEGKQKLRAGITIAACTCAIGVERFLREATPDDQRGTLIFENNDARVDILRNHNYLRSPEAIAEREHLPDWSEFLPFQRIAEAPVFKEKRETPLLQVADAVAFTLNRKRNQAAGIDRFFDPINGQLILRLNDLGARPRTNPGRGRSRRP